jgi:hypothetical protein
MEDKNEIELGCVIRNDGKVVNIKVCVSHQHYPGLMEKSSEIRH